MTVPTRRGALHFYCPGTGPIHRADTFLSKEPDTIEWLETLAPGDVMWDVGANVGTYSLYAALMPGVHVLAFEPAAVNYYVLNRNIELNLATDRVLALCVAFNDVSSLDRFYMANTEYAGAFHSFGKPVDWRDRPFKPAFTQAMLGYSIDDFIRTFKPPFPTHIKIDVDGGEGRIIAGAAETISDQRLRSLLVELDTARDDYCGEVVNRLESAGLKVRSMGTNAFSSACNYVFARP